ncbi:SMI1/KNR4 family protein [Halobacillus faecis]
MDIWVKDYDDDPYKLEDIDDQIIHAFEKELNLKLPLSYKGILQNQNGGIIKYNSIHASSFPEGEVYIEINHIYGIGHPGLLDSPYLIKEWDLRQNILVFNGEGNAWFALDYTSEPPHVIYIDADSKEVIKVASSFGHFLKKLTFTELIQENEKDSWSKEEAEIIFSGQEEFLIEEVLLSYQDTEDIEWYLAKLLQLTEHSSLLVRETVANVIRDNTEYFLYEGPEPSLKILNRIINHLSRDRSEGIRWEMKEVKDQYDL